MSIHNIHFCGIIRKMSQCTTKPKIRLVPPVNTQISLRIWAVWSVFADQLCLLQPLGYPKRDKQEPLPYWVDAQADLSLCRSHRSYCSITKTHLFILKILPPENENFQIENSDIFHISAQSIDCGYTLELLWWVVLMSTHNQCFWAEIRKIMYTPVNPSFTI